MKDEFIRLFIAVSLQCKIKMGNEDSYIRDVDVPYFRAVFSLGGDAGHWGWRGERLRHPQPVHGRIRQEGQTQLRRHPRHGRGVPLHPLHRRPVREVHGLHLRHVLQTVLARP